MAFENTVKMQQLNGRDVTVPGSSNMFVATISISPELAAEAKDFKTMEEWKNWPIFKTIFGWFLESFKSYIVDTNEQNRTASTKNLQIGLNCWIPLAFAFHVDLDACIIQLYYAVDLSRTDIQLLKIAAVRLFFIKQTLNPIYNDFRVLSLKNTGFYKEDSNIDKEVSAAIPKMLLSGEDARDWFPTIFASILSNTSVQSQKDAEKARKAAEVADKKIAALEAKLAALQKNNNSPIQTRKAELETQIRAAEKVNSDQSKVVPAKPTLTSGNGEDVESDSAEENL